MFILIIFFWAVFSLAVAVYANDKKVSGGFLGGLLISLIFSPLIGLIAVALTKPNQKSIDSGLVKSGQMKKCTQCAEMVKSEALKCRFCGLEFSPESFIHLKEEKIENHKADTRKTLVITIVILLIFAALIMAIR